MIINDVKKDVQTVGNFPTSNFRIAASAKAFQILSSNIYTHKVRAVIREISCNAADAHIAAKNPNKFDVHLPTLLEPWFSVRDYGTGLSETDIREIYTTYFTSTKTESNEFTGALGLGSKSPFCLVDSFTVTSWFADEKKVYSCYKDSNGEPQIALLTCEASNEPKGLEVHVPGLNDRRSSFEEEAVEVFQYFEETPGFNINVPSVFQRISRAKSQYVVNGPDFAFNIIHGSPKAVMGNVAYEIPYNVRGTLGLGGYIKFPLGSLSFDPGRENLSLDDSTIKTIKARIAEVTSELGQYCLETVEKEPTTFKRYLKCEKLISGSMGSFLRDLPSSTVKNKLFNYRMPVLSKCAKVFFKAIRKNSVHVEYKSVLDFMSDKLFICIDKPRMDRRLKNYAKTNCLTIFALTQEQVDELQIDPEFIGDIDTIPKITNFTTKRSNGKTTEPVRYWDRTTCDLREVDLLPDGEKVFVPIKNKKLSSKFLTNSSIDNLPNCRARLDICDLGTTSHLYVVKEGRINSKRFQKEMASGEWIHLDDFARRQLMQKLDLNLVQDEVADHEIHLFEAVANFEQTVFQGNPPAGFEIFRNFMYLKAKSDDQWLIVNLLENSLGESVSRQNDLKTMRNQIFADFPMLKLANWSSFSAATRKMENDRICAEYISGILALRGLTN